MQSKFEDYVNISEKNNLHTELEILTKKPLSPTNTTSNETIASQVETTHINHDNLIFYGPAGIGKYTQVLKYIKRFSPSKLKYERKIDINLGKKRQFMFKISDIHFEIDMELLGCNARLLWNDIYKAIVDIINTRQSHTGIIVCKNFHKIHNELLDIFYSYMQSLEYKNMYLTFILITEAVSFIPNNVLKRCSIVNVRRPTITNYKRCIPNKTFLKSININKITNIKDVVCGNTNLININKKIVTKLISNIENYNDIDYLEFRDTIYKLFIYNIELDECLWDILKYFIEKNILIGEKLEKAQDFLYDFFKFYNNNYRPIYHLERLMLYICKLVNEL